MKKIVKVTATFSNYNDVGEIISTDKPTPEEMASKLVQANEQNGLEVLQVVHYSPRVEQIDDLYFVHVAMILLVEE